jgi:hypothetical protein
MFCFISALKLEHPLRFKILPGVAVLLLRLYSTKAKGQSHEKNI